MLGVADQVDFDDLGARNREAECAALALTVAITQLSGRADPILNEIWDEAARHYDEPALATLAITMVTINAWNLINITTRQVAGAR